MEDAMYGAGEDTPIFASLLAPLMPTIGADEDILPRKLPLIGFLRHAPQQVLHGQLDRLLRRRNQPRAEEIVDPSDEAEQKSQATSELPRASPYVGFQRHAPLSPTLNFSSLTPASCGSPLSTFLDSQLDLDLVDGDTCSWEEYEDDDKAPHTPGRLPDELWGTVLSYVAEVPSLCRLCRICRGFPEALKNENVWARRPIHIAPTALQGLAPHLGTWLPAWRCASRIVVPRSSQLLAELARRAPELPVQVAWRFDANLKGDGVEVLRSGLTARRIAEEELVVLGDASLRTGRGLPYFEVELEERCEESLDVVNDLGLGVTACAPEEIRSLGSVADEVPRSWVVDFTQSSVVLSVDNREAAKGKRVSSKDLREGDRIGLRISSGNLEVYINGEMREVLEPTPADRVPDDIELFPILDLYGRTVQISRNDAEVPRP